MGMLVVTKPLGIVSNILPLHNLGDPDYVLSIKQPLFSKARPRLTRSGHAYMPQPYKDSQSRMRTQLVEQWSNEPLEGPVALVIKAKGEGRGDADNIAGAFMDAAQGIVFTDDRVSNVPILIFSWEKASKSDSCWLVSIFLL